MRITSIISACCGLLALWCLALPAHAQVINQIGQENMKIPRGMKPQQQQSTNPDLVTIDTETPYFQCIDSAQTYIDAHEWQLAEKWLRQAVATDPGNANNSLVLSNIATIQRYQGRLDEAVKNYTLALDMTPHAVTLLLNRAALFVEMDSLQRAQDDFERVRQLDPYNTEARYSLGVLAMESGDNKRAEDLFNEVKRINPNSGLYNEGMALLHKRNGNYARAAELFTQLIKVQPNTQLLGNRADCYLMLKRLNEAEDDIRTALEMNPDDGYLYVLRAKLNKLRFQREDMERDIELAVQHGVSRGYVKQLLEVK